MSLLHALLPSLALGWALAAATTPAPLPSVQDILLDLSAGRAEDALSKADARLVREPRDAKTHEARGRALHALGRYEEATEAYFQALELDPGSRSAHFHLGESAFAQGFWPEAIEFYRVHAERTTGAPRTVLKLVYCHIANGDLNEAGKWLARLDPFDDSFPGYYFGKAAFAQAMGKKEEPSKLIQQARTLYGNRTANEFEIEMLQIWKKDSSPSPDPARPSKSATKP